MALFIDEAHDLHSSTLTGLKRLIELVEDSGGLLSIVLGGHWSLDKSAIVGALDLKVEHSMGEAQINH